MLISSFEQHKGSLSIIALQKPYSPPKKKKKSKNSRISEKNAYISRARCHSKKKGQKTHSPHRLMSPTRLQGQELILIVNQSHDSKTNQSWPKPKVVISKKTVKKATDRNRIKRIIRQALDSLNLKDGQITVIIKKNIANLKMEQVKQKLEDYLKI